MKKLNAEELKKIEGGGWKLISSIVSITALIIGIIDGYIRPKKCN